MNNHKDTAPSEPEGPATEEKLWELHRELTNIFLKLIRNNISKPLKASLLSVIRLFLSDNGINASSMPDMEKGLEDLEGLDLPFPVKPQDPQLN